MKQEATSSDQEVSEKGNGEYGIMTMFPTVDDTFESKEDKNEVSQGIDNLRCVRSGIVILAIRQLAALRKVHAGRQTSSHQLIVEVTGSQKAGYEGS